jgi:hypothetical protein
MPCQIVNASSAIGATVGLGSGVCVATGVGCVVGAGVGSTVAVGGTWVGSTVGVGGTGVGAAGAGVGEGGAAAGAAGVRGGAAVAPGGATVALAAATVGGACCLMTGVGLGPSANTVPGSRSVAARTRPGANRRRVVMSSTFKRKARLEKSSVSFIRRCNPESVRKSLSPRGHIVYRLVQSRVHEEIAIAERLPGERPWLHPPRALNRGQGWS